MLLNKDTENKFQLGGGFTTHPKYMNFFVKHFCIQSAFSWSLSGGSVRPGLWVLNVLSQTYIRYRRGSQKMMSPFSNAATFTNSSSTARMRKFWREHRSSHLLSSPTLASTREAPILSPRWAFLESWLPDLYHCGVISQKLTECGKTPHFIDPPLPLMKFSLATIGDHARFKDR